MTPSRSAPLAIALAIALAACAGQQTGIMAGRVTAPNRPSSTATISWEEGGFSDGGSIHATLEGGERFSGKFVRISSATSVEVVGPIYAAWGPVWGPAWGMAADPWYAGGADAFIRLHTGQVVATLFGDQGDSMRCRFQVTEPEEGLPSGGVGQCQTSNGLEVAVQF